MSNDLEGLWQPVYAEMDGEEVAAEAAEGHSVHIPAPRHRLPAEHAQPSHSLGHRHDGTRHLGARHRRPHHLRLTPPAELEFCGPRQWAW